MLTLARAARAEQAHGRAAVRAPERAARRARGRARRGRAPGRHATLSAPLAERLAASEADLHEAVSLLTKGCSPATAAEILL